MIRGSATTTRHDGDVSEFADDGAGRLDIHDLPAESRYESTLDGDPVGELTYRRDGDVLTIFHTGTYGDATGRGLASALVGAVLDETRAAKGHVLVMCPFVTAYIDKHPEYADLVVQQAARSAQPSEER